tara:strand:+ start:218 stop:376 length:159 start_codon:yes stop_codon:yes gene_type:complete
MTAFIIGIIIFIVVLWLFSASLNMKKDRQFDEQEWKAKRKAGRSQFDDEVTI